MNDHLDERIRRGLQAAADRMTIDVPVLPAGPRPTSRRRGAVAAVAALVFAVVGGVFFIQSAGQPQDVTLIRIASVVPPPGVGGVQWQLRAVERRTEPVRLITDLSFHVDPNGLVDGSATCAWLKAQFSVADGQMSIGWWSRLRHRCPPDLGPTTPTADVVDVLAVLSSTSSRVSLRDGSLILTAGELTLTFTNSGPALPDQFPTWIASTATSSSSVSSTP